MTQFPLRAKSNRRVALAFAAIPLTMLGLAYASVPLYSLFCQATGFGGTTQRADVAPANVAEQSITIRFDANVDPALGWNFHPRQTTMQVKLGEVGMAHYIALNRQSTVTTGTAMFNVTPPEAGVFFNKIACFCFTEQTLAAGQQVDMPVQFFVDPALLDDPDTRSIREITLSYTFYPATPKAADKQAAITTN